MPEGLPPRSAAVAEVGGLLHLVVVQRADQDKNEIQTDQLEVHRVGIAKLVPKAIAIHGHLDDARREEGQGDVQVTAELVPIGQQQPNLTHQRLSFQGWPEWALMCDHSKTSSPNLACIQWQRDRMHAWISKWQEGDQWPAAALPARVLSKPKLKCGVVEGCLPVNSMAHKMAPNMATVSARGAVAGSSTWKQCVPPKRGPEIVLTTRMTAGCTTTRRVKKGWRPVSVKFHNWSAAHLTKLGCLQTPLEWQSAIWQAAKSCQEYQGQVVTAGFRINCKCEHGTTTSGDAGIESLNEIRLGAAGQSGTRSSTWLSHQRSLTWGKSEELLMSGWLADGKARGASRARVLVISLSGVRTGLSGWCSIRIACARWTHAVFL